MGSFKISEIQKLIEPTIQVDYSKQAEEWWNELDSDETIQLYIKHGCYRNGGWGHDIGPTREDVIDLYKMEFNL